MRTLYVRVDPARPDPAVVADAGRILNAGSLVAFPTETVYGLGANGLNPEAVESIFWAKGRPRINPVSLLIADREQLAQLTTDPPEFVELLMERFWPGPLTMVLKRSAVVPDEVTAGTDSVGIRMPDHPVALALIRAAGVPVAAPSANLSGRMSPTTADQVIADLDGRISMVLDAGPTGVGIESTVLDCTVSPPLILRPGAIAVEHLEMVLGMSLATGSGSRPAVPRWQISARVIVCDGDRDQRIHCFTRELSRPAGLRCGLLVTDETMGLLGPAVQGVTVKSIGSEQDPETIAGRLFPLMRELDRDHDVLIVEGIAETGLGRAIMDRLRSAAGPVSGTIRILVICTGNTCRSAMAEQLLIRAATRLGVVAEVRSAGVAAGDGYASVHAVAVMAEQGMDLSNHRSRQLTPDMIDQSDIVLVMTPEHRKTLLELANAEHKTFLFGSYPDQVQKSIADPFGGGINSYRRCRDQLANRAEQIMLAISGDPGRNPRSNTE